MSLPPTTSSFRLPKLELPRIVRQHRRLSAALLAALAVLVVGMSARPAPPITVDAHGAVVVPAGLIAVPLALTNSAVGALLHAGEHVDVVALPADASGIARVIARNVIVLIPPESSGFLSGEEATVLVATTETNALAIAGASDGGLTVIVHPPQ